jgi:hypothetical protein
MRVSSEECNVTRACIQVPLPFIFEMDSTYELKGAKRVVINQLGPSLSKRQCTAQICFRPEAPPPSPETASAEAKERFRQHSMAQPPPCIIFRGTGARVSQRELDAYPPDLVVLWQPKAWVDRPVARAWVQTCYKLMIDADIASGVASSSDDRYLLFQDNLDAQCQTEYLELLREQCRTDDHKVPPNKTDQTQPIDRGLGRHVKILMGAEEEAWLEDDENLQRWENNELSASDRRILIATWFCKALKMALASDAARKYFQHAGALLTADGSDDHLIKLEGVPPGETFTWNDDDGEVDAPVLGEEGSELEPPDACPEREETRPRGDPTGDDAIASDASDVADDEDLECEAPPAPKEPPPGFKFDLAVPSPEELSFSKERVHAVADTLLGRHLLYRWPDVGWCVGLIKSRNTDARVMRKIGGVNEKVNFFIHYQIDDTTCKTVLRAEEFNGEGPGAWVLLAAM